MKKNKKKYIILLLLFIAVGMGIGYSLLQQQLKIQGTATVDPKYSMEIIGIEQMFSGDKVNYAIMTNTWDALGAGGIEEDEVPISTESYTADTAVFDISFKATNTIVLYKVTIRNTGNLDAKISNVNINKTGNEAIEVKQLTDINNLVIEPSTEVIYMFTVEVPDGAKVDLENLTAQITITVDTEQYVSSSSSNDVFIQNPYIYFGGRGSNDQVSSQEIKILQQQPISDCKLMISVNGASAVEYAGSVIGDNKGFYFNFVTYDYTAEAQDYNPGDKLDMYAVCTRTSNISSKEVSAESNHITFNYASNTGA